MQSRWSDTVTLRLSFLDASSSVIGDVALADPTTGTFDWNLVNSTAPLPSGTRTLQLDVEMRRSGGGSTDAYADDISLVVRLDGVPVPEPHPLAVSLALLALALAGRRRRV